MARAFIGMGSNLGDRLETLGVAAAAIEELPETRVEAVSSVYESEPWGVTEQPPFANAVIAIDTDLRADQLMEALLAIEDRLGRQRELRHGPRTIDLDILLFGDEEWTRPDLTVPHPGLAERDFAITPLLEIAPDATWPDGKALTRDRVSVGRILGVLGELPDAEEEQGLPPIAAEDWVAVAEGLTMPPDMGLRFKQLVLEQAGIPYAWDPFPPDEETQPFALAMPLKLLVPEDRAAEATKLLADADAAPMDAEEGGMPVDFDAPDVPASPDVPEEE